MDRIDTARLERLPGHEIIRDGLRDLANGGPPTANALIVAIGAPRLRELGVALPAALPDAPEARLFELLQRDHGDGAHARYNALVRRLVSFEHALATHAATR